jgi:two-component system chemotaxis response regulator CheB
MSSLDVHSLASVPPSRVHKASRSQEIATRDIVVVGASAGGVEALSKLTHGLPPDLPAAVFVVLHVMAGRSMLAPILSGPLPATTAVEGERFARSRIYVAPAGFHMVLDSGRVRLMDSPREQGCRPAIDPLFRSAAHNYGPRVIGVVLSGLLRDGAEGLAVVKDHGGLAVVQDPSDAKYPAMPTAAMASTVIDRVAPVNCIASVLMELVGEPVSMDPDRRPEGV